jgi:hypothetical protein
LLNQHGQVLTVVEAVLVAAATLAVAALLEAALAPHQPFTVADFEQGRLFGVHTLPGEVSAGQLPRLDSIMAALECPLGGRAGSLLWETDH